MSGDIPDTYLTCAKRAFVPSPHDRWFHFAFFPVPNSASPTHFQKCCAQAFTIHLSLPYRYCSGRSVYSLANLLSVGVVQREPTTREKR